MRVRNDNVSVAGPPPPSPPTTASTITKVQIFRSTGQRRAPNTQAIAAFQRGAQCGKRGIADKTHQMSIRCQVTMKVTESVLMSTKRRALESLCIERDQRRW